MDWSGISQNIGGSADNATFVLGNADRVFTALSNDVDLIRASVQFSLFNVATGLLINLWAGNLVNYQTVAGPQFTVTAQDGIYEVGLPYPTRKISRTCNKIYDNAGNGCPATANAISGTLSTPCDKGFDTAAGCLYHGMGKYFGGVLVQLQGVQIKDNSTGTWGFGRDSLNSVSLVSDSIFDEVMPEIYVNHHPNTDDPNDSTRGYPVNAKIAEGRDEGDYYVALGIVGEGPLGRYADVTTQYCPHRLDDQPAHGWPKQVGADGGCWGLRRSFGHDPAQNNDPDAASDQFSLSQGGAGPQSYGTAQSGGTAFVELRRRDATGLQLSTLDEHAMTVVVYEGLACWRWTGPGARTSSPGCTNPIWIAVNAYLKAVGLKYAAATTQEQYFDVASAVYCAAICDLTTGPHLIGTDVRPQFEFVGILQEQKPLRDWLTEILNNALCGYTFSFNRLKFYARENSSVVTDGAFTADNIAFNSLVLTPLAPAFNYLTVNFADENFDFTNNSVVYYDIDYATAIGTPGGSPYFVKGELNLSGTPNQNQAAIIAATRGREELGGVNAAEQLAARNIAWQSTVLSLNRNAE